MEVEKYSTEYKIIKSTLELLNENGLNGTTTRKIAEKAGVSEVTIFRNFKNKKQLLNVVKDFYSEKLLNEIKDILKFDENTEINEYLKNILKNSVNLSNNNLNIIKIALEEIRDIPLEDKVLPKFSKEIINILSDFFQLKINQGEIAEINPKVAAIMIFSTIFETIVIWKIYEENQDVDVDAYLDNFLKLFINGIAIK